MPIYAYRCADCGAEIEKRQGFAEAPLTTCESCGGSLRRLLFAAGVIFKGSGFYSTDYRGGSNGKKSADADGKSATDKGSESAAASPSKPESGEKASTSKSEPVSSGAKSD